MAKKAKVRRDVVSPFRDKLWDLFKEKHPAWMVPMWFWP
jgi:hypothetical protein